MKTKYILMVMLVLSVGALAYVMLQGPPSFLQFSIPTPTLTQTSVPAVPSVPTFPKVNPVAGTSGVQSSAPAGLVVPIQSPTATPAAATKQGKHAKKGKHPTVAKTAATHAAAPAAKKKVQKKHAAAAAHPTSSAPTQPTKTRVRLSSSSVAAVSTDHSAKGYVVFKTHSCVFVTSDTPPPASPCAKDSGYVVLSSTSKAASIRPDTQKTTLTPDETLVYYIPDAVITKVKLGKQTAFKTEPATYYGVPAMRYVP